MMKKGLRKSIAMVAVLVFVLAVGVGCTRGEPIGGRDGQEPAPGTDARGDAREVKIGAVNWDDCIALTNVAKVVLEDHMGYTVDDTYADVGPVFASVASGNYDVFLDAWLPVTHSTYMDQYGEDLDELGTIYTGARIGLVVPEYVDIDSIEEFNDVREKFDNEIVGIDAGAGIMEKTEEVIAEYELDVNLITSSGPMMAAALMGAIDNEEWIAVTGWSPHWKFGRWDLKYLDDPKNIYGEDEYVAIVARKGLEDDLPEVANFFSNFQIELDELEELMSQMQDADETEQDVATRWVEDNMDRVNEWIGAG